METHKHYKKAFILLSLLLASLFLTLQILPTNNLVASGNMGTQVGGILTSDTTWTTANSPYTIISTIQIPENVNLAIEQGVRVTAQPSVDTMFLINGVIQAHGSATNKIVFDGNGHSNFFKTNHLIDKGFVDLDYCIIRNGQSVFWFSNTGSFNLTNSDLSNLSQESYLWYPSQDIYIEFNTFTNTSGIKIATDDYSSNSPGFVFIKYNLFINNQGYIINNFASYGLSKTFVNNNSFSDTSGTILQVEKTSTTADMDASQNYWGTSNSTIIDSKIYDKNDDLSCSSYISYLPVLDAADPDVPITPTPTPSPTPALIPTDAPAPSSSPTTHPDPSSFPDPSAQPTASPTSGTTPTPTSPQLYSPTPNPTSNPENPNPNLTIDMKTSDASASPSNTPSVPEFPIWTALLILLLTGLTASKALKRKLDH